MALKPPSGPSGLPPVPTVLSQMFKEVLEPVSDRNTPTTSRLGILPDGTVVPVLVLLATLKFGEDFDEETHSPIWRDGNPRNETWDNVALREIRTRRRTSGIKGIKSGTPEYWREYRRLHKEKNAAYQKAYRTRRNALIAALQQVERTTETQVNEAHDESVMDEIAALLRED
jgi:hypothetical protein